MAHYSFKEDLSHAKRVENDLAGLLCRRGRVLWCGANDDKRWDIEANMSDGTVKTIEVKNDMLYERTGNIGVEFSSWGKPSGILTTEADWWCFALYDGYWLVPTLKLKELVSKRMWHRVAVGGDPGSDTAMYLFRGAVLKQHMTLLKEV